MVKAPNGWRHLGATQKPDRLTTKFIMPGSGDLFSPSVACLNSAYSFSITSLLGRSGRSLIASLARRNDSEAAIALEDEMVLLATTATEGMLRRSREGRTRAAIIWNNGCGKGVATLTGLRPSLLTAAPKWQIAALR